LAPLRRETKHELGQQQNEKEVLMSLRPYKTFITCIAAICATASVTVVLLFAGIAAACAGGGGGGGGCTAPTVSTGSATSITSNSATLNGSVNPNGCETFYAFEYGRSSEGYPNEVEGIAGHETFPKSVSTSSPLGLEPSTSYHFRLSAWNSYGETTGSSVPFTTAPSCSKPTVTTESASFIRSDKAFLNGKVVPINCSAQYTFEYGLAGSGTYAKLTGTVGLLGPFAVSREVTGLEANKLYTFRLSATSTAGKSDGSFLNFTTQPKYVAMGDSYSAGTGTGTSYEPGNSGTCHRTTKAYPYLLHNAHPDWGYVNVACHGAESPELVKSQAKSLTKDTTFVTYTIGGNDAGFSDVLETCKNLTQTTPCMEVLATEKKFIENTLPKKLDEVNNTIKANAPYAKVIVLNYPRIFKKEVEDCDTVTVFLEADMIEMNKLADLIGEKLQQAAGRAGANFKFVNVIPEFSTHALCDAQEWLTNAMPTAKTESFHPNILGHQQGYYPLVHAVTG
jgi:lysophospholipase L1-like esterase